jgi:hypothetical protein
MHCYVRSTLHIQMTECIIIIRLFTCILNKPRCYYRFVPAKFEEIFTKHAKVRPDALTSEEIEEMILANRDPLDPESW